jgi:hypothetical protein
MNRSSITNLYAMAVCAASLMTQLPVIADESSSVSTTSSTPSETNSTSYKAETGPGGAKVSKTNASVHGNGDGSVSANRSQESHTLTDGGSAHRAANSSTTVKPDGSAATTSEESSSTAPQ